MKNTFWMILAAIFVVGAFAAAASAQQRVALYRYVSPVSKNDAYAAAPAEREKYKKAKYEEINVVGYVYLAPQPGTTKLFSLVKRNADGTGEHFYTADFNTVLAKQESEGLGKWVVNSTNKGVAGYVPVAAGATVKAVTRFVQPDGATGIYAFSKAEVSGLTAKGLSNQGTAFYVYESAETETSGAAKKIDLQMGEILKVADKWVNFRARSIGGDAPAQSVRVEISAFNADGSVRWRQTRPIEQAFLKGKPTEITVNLIDGKTLSGLKYKLKIDGDDNFAETNEANNESKMSEGPPLRPEYKPLVVPAFPVEPKSTAAPDENLVQINVPSRARVDLSVRNALYFNGADTTTVSTASRYAAPGGSPLRLKKSQALACAGDVCEFNLGFFAMRGSGAGALLTHATLSGAAFGSVGDSVSFANGERSVGVVYKVKLKVGENAVKVAIDPLGKTRESDEGNNGFEVVVVVEP